MSVQGYSGPVPSPSNGTASALQRLWGRPARPRYWLHLLLLVLTLATTTAMGARMMENFRLNRPTFDVERDLDAFVQLWSNPLTLASGLAFSLTLLAILLAHEFGHYLACRYYRVDASLPYFLPGPPFFGTFGAFIRIRSPIYSKQVLFDIGIAGPIAGFVLLLPALAIGLAYSKVLPGIGHHGELAFGVPPLLHLMETLIFPGVATADIYLHPVARAAWVGIFATALNLLPIGQLDGGHILYSFVGRHHRALSRVFSLALLPMGYLTNYWPWYLWAAVLFLFGLRHPAIFDSTALSTRRKYLGAAALVMFLLCFMLVPIAVLTS